MIDKLAEMHEHAFDQQVKKHLARALRRMVYIATLPTLPVRNKVSNHNLTRAEIFSGKYDGKIPCIKMHRARTHLSLVESKHIVEDYFVKNSLTFRGYDIHGFLIRNHNSNV